MVKGYIFDMDGVLCDSEAFIAEAAIRLFRERYAVSAKEADFSPFVGMGEERFLTGVGEQYGLEMTMPGDKNELYRIYAECIRGRLKPLPGVKRFIQNASEAGLKVAVATSADAIKLQANLSEIKLATDRFDALVTGLDIKHKKPAPDIFLEAAQRLGLDPSECVVFEDAINGVQSAKAAGAYCIGITSSFTIQELIDAGADAIFPDFEMITLPALP